MCGQIGGGILAERVHGPWEMAREVVRCGGGRVVCRVVHSPSGSASDATVSNGRRELRQSRSAGRRARYRPCVMLTKPEARSTKHEARGRRRPRGEALERASDYLHVWFRLLSRRLPPAAGWPGYTPTRTCKLFIHLSPSMQLSGLQLGSYRDVFGRRGSALTPPSVRRHCERQQPGSCPPTARLCRAQLRPRTSNQGSRTGCPRPVPSTPGAREHELAEHAA